jgi:IS30 family transposase
MCENNIRSELMGHNHNTTKGVGKSSHFTEDERKILEKVYNARGKERNRSPTSLGRLLGKDRTTIIREVKRGLTEIMTDDEYIGWKYLAKTAQEDADWQKSAHGPDLKIGSDTVLVEKLEAAIKDGKKSPYAAVQDFINEGWPTETRIGWRTVYRYIDAGLAGAVTRENLLRKGKMKKHRKSGDDAPKHSREGARERSIDKRPACINDRSEGCHWEMDTVRGKKNGSQACLLTLTERKWRLEIIIRLSDGKSETVKAAIDKLERDAGYRFKFLFKSITPDNGTEFSDFEGLEASCLGAGKRFDLYFAHPYRACERGTNENHNGIIRRFFPKGTDFADVSDEQVRSVQRWMNRYPRKILGGHTPLMAAQHGGLPFNLSFGML